MDLDAPPSVRPLLVKAFLGGFTRRTGEKLPETEYTLRDTTVDVDHLAAYDRVCGFRLGDALPATYPHIMVFPLAMRLMTDPGFPFPVVGLVHVGNRITQTRPLLVGEKLTLSVRADDPRP